MEHDILYSDDRTPESLRQLLIGYTRKLERKCESPTDSEFDVVTGLVERLCIVDTDEIVKIFMDSLDLKCEKIVTVLKDKEGEFLHVLFRQHWGDYHTYLEWMTRMFAPLARFSPNFEAPQYAENCFDDTILNQFSPKLAAEAIRLVRCDRIGLLKSDVLLFKETLGKMVGKQGFFPARNLYEDDFAKPFLEDTYQYYSDKALTWIAEIEDHNMYVSISEACMEIETQRAGRFVQASTLAKLKEKVGEAFWFGIKDRGAEIVTQSREHLKNNKVDLMYLRYKTEPAYLNLIAAIFKQHIYEEGMAFIRQAEDATDSMHIAEEYVGWIKHAELAAIYEVHITRNIRLYEGLLADLRSCFKEELRFKKAVDEAFGSFLQKGVAGKCCTELLSMYFLKNVEMEKRANTETVTKLLKLVANDGDALLFSSLHREKPRLLIGCSIYGSLEIHVLNSFGRWSNSEMEKMVKGLSRAQDIANSFEEYLKMNPDVHPGIDMSINILDSRLRSGHESDSSTSLPAEMVKGSEVFEGFYRTNSDGQQKELSWCIRGWCRVTCNLDADPFEIDLPTNLAVMLALFNTQEEEHSYSHIRHQTKLDEHKLMRLVNCLLHDGILSKKPNTVNISESDQLMLTSNCNEILRRIKISEQDC